MGDGDLTWFYLDSTGSEYGPFPASTMRDWFAQGFFPIGEDLPVRLPSWKQHVALRMVYPDIDTAFIGPPRPVNLDGQDAGPPSYTGGGFAGRGGPYPGDGPPARGGGRGRGRGGGGGGGGGRGAEEAPPFVAPQPWSPQAGGYWMMPGAGGCPAPTMPGYGFPPARPGMPGGMPGAMPGSLGVPDMMRGGMPRGPPGPFPGSPFLPTPGAGAMTGRYQGRIKSFNAKQGFGFIECPEVHQMYGRDVFLHKAQIGDFKVGTEVIFNIEPNKQGMPQARDIQTIDGQMPGPSPAGPAKAGAPGGRGKGGGPGGGKGGKGKKGGGKGNQGGQDAVQDFAAMTMGAN